MNFYEWMIKKYLGKDSMRGDFAVGMKKAADFPNDYDRERILTYLNRKNACDNCIQVYKRCWRDYERECNREKTCY